MNENKSESMKVTWGNVVTRATYESATFFLTRYPYLCAVLLMVTTAEDARGRKVDDGSLRQRFVYVNVGTYFICATFMAFDLFGLKRLFSLVTCFHLVFVSYSEYTLSYGEQICYRLLTRNVACIGCYLMVAGGIAKNKGESDRSRLLVSFGRQMIGVYAVLSVVLAWNDINEYQAFMKPFYGQHFFVVTFLTFQVFLGLSLYTGYEAVKFSKFYAVLLLGTTVFIDADLVYWEKTVGLKTWNSATIASRHLPIIFVMLLIRRGYS